VSSSSQLTQPCKNCSSVLEPGALACPQCHTLVHAQELAQLTAEAKSLEAAGQWQEAREKWLKAADLLPSEATQALWVRDHVRKIDAASNVAGPGSEPKNNWARKLGPLAPIAVALAKGKLLLSLFSLKFFFSLAAFMAVYWALFGAKFGIGFSLLILFHELGHFIDVKRRSLPAEMPVFLPGLGAYVRWQALGVPLETRSAVSLAGPLAGWIASAICTLVWWHTGSEIWAALARASAWLNVLNLIPVWALDGGQAIQAMDKTERIVLLCSGLALWLLVGESVFFLVAAGACWRLFTKDIPERASRPIAAYFISVLAGLALIMWIEIK
jgi:Zn-dependent protease